jgi:hypothetical protein
LSLRAAEVGVFSSEGRSILLTRCSDHRARVERDILSTVRNDITNFDPHGELLVYLKDLAGLWLQRSPLGYRHYSRLMG